MGQQEPQVGELPQAGLGAFLLRRDNKPLLLHMGFGLFALLSLYFTLTHAPWRDEATTWQFSRYMTWSEVFYVARHDGHPSFWILCVKLLQALGGTYVWMELLNWCFCLTGIGLCFYFSSLPLVVRLALAFSPACVADVACLGRNYAMAMPLIFLAAIWHRTNRERPLRYAAVLALIANCNLYATAVFGGLAVQFLLEQAAAAKSPRSFWRPWLTRYAAANLIMVLGGAVLIAQLIPIHLPGDPFPDTKDPIDLQLYRLKKFKYLGIVVAAVMVALIHRRPLVLSMVITMAVASVPALFYGCYGRHMFMLILGLVYACWVYYDDWMASGRVLGWSLRPWLMRALISSIVVVPALSFFASPADYTHAKSDSRRAAQAIIAAGLDRDDVIMVGTDAYRPESLLLFLQKIDRLWVPPDFGPSPEFYGLNAYVPQMLAHSYGVNDIRSLVLKTAQEHPGKTILVVVSGPGCAQDPNPQDADYRLREIYVSAKPWPDTEPYRIFVLQP